MGFPYVEPSIEELNERIAGGDVYVQSSLSGIYKEYFAPVLESERIQATGMPAVSGPEWSTFAGGVTQSAPVVYSQQSPTLPVLGGIAESIPVFYGQEGTQLGAQAGGPAGLGTGLGLAVLALMVLFARSRK